MPPTMSRRSGKTSIISVDPAVVSQITTIAESEGLAGHSRNGSAPLKNAPLSTMSRRHVRNHSDPVSQLKKRSNSLRQAKNSTELLKLRNERANRQVRAGEQVPSAQGRTFTVSNVGTGGVLHLSPTPGQPSFSPVSMSPNSMVWPQPAVTTLAPTSLEPILPSQPLRARTRSISPKRLLERARRNKNSEENARMIRNRSQSFSTLDESRRSVSVANKQTTYKVIINRPPSMSSEEEEQEEDVPTLAIPIPSHRLGTPRFSAHGTPFLRGTSYRGSDVTSTTTPRELGSKAGGPPMASAKAWAKLQQMQRRENGSPFDTEHWRGSNATSINRHNSSITSRMYDDLLLNYHDPSVVRYTAGDERNIIAATKIRLIAQISSEDFMDYELVSDFFLTFRLYMTTFEVLDYLLARLRWSLARMTDDGRIIRIRTFAALRHWVLNYFAEDFVINRDLRSRFCEEVNDLYTEVERRPDSRNTASDLKVLQDLKRCWNGRCSMYWDLEEFNMEIAQEEPIIPGGVIGSRNADFQDVAQATGMLGLGLDTPVADIPLPPAAVSTRSPSRKQHKRLPSSDHAKKPQSVASASSIQPNSCSLPTRLTRSSKEREERQGRAPQPVSVQSRRQNAPADLRVHVQKPSIGQESYAGQNGNVVEEDTGQTSVQAMTKSGYHLDPHAGSMIRGFVYGPVEPFVQLPFEPPPSPFTSFDPDDAQRYSGGDSPRSPDQPAVKNIFGSIRRALSGKQASNEVALIQVDGQRQGITQAGRRVRVPVNLARSNDSLRRQVAGFPTKTQLRIDLLCAAAVESFQNSIPGSARAPGSAPLPSHNAAASPPLSATDRLDPHQEMTRRDASRSTARSGSILIVDDTAVAIPVMSGALPGAYTHHGLSAASVHSSPTLPSEHFAPAEQQNNSPVRRSTMDTSAGKSQVARHLEPIESQPRASQISRSSGVTVKPAHSTTTSPRIDAAAYRPTERTPSPASMTEATTNTGSPASIIPGQPLRRRPGGDLRSNENVHDMQGHHYHPSLDSMLESSSAGGSLHIISQNEAVEIGPTHGRISNRISMINTHSSQQLRPSFQAAIAGFSGLGNDEDGGLEATMAKLEGRYEISVTHPSTSGTNRSFAPSGSTAPTDHTSEYAHQQQPYPGQFQPYDPVQAQHFPRQLEYGPMAELDTRPMSRNSEMSLPALPQHMSIGKAVTTDDYHDEEEDEARSSSDILETRGDGDNLPSPVRRQPVAMSTIAFDDEEAVSDLSSEISIEAIRQRHLPSRSSPLLAAPGTALSADELPNHPLTHTSLVDIAIENTPIQPQQGFRAQSHPLTPDSSPLLLQAANGRAVAIPKDQLSHINPTNLNSIRSQTLTQVAAGPAHAPFILACDSLMLARQFTLVEQSALTEIEWVDLVEMRWSLNNKNQSCLDWAEYMSANDDARGIDVVITRFNLVSRWVMSEIVLTQDIDERARVISKLIHLAAHARRLHNYATMLQVTLALMSTSCTRLKKTWEKVPDMDRNLLKHMERLAQPMRNFAELRAEMETDDLSDGCIPFIGLYVHDLNYNAQKPAEIRVGMKTNGEEEERLINFKRFRTAATIIKGLLRLIDASLKYEIEPVHGVVERCLWLSALSEGRAEALSKALEAQ